MYLEPDSFLQETVDRERLVMASLGQVRSIARRIYRRLPSHIAMEDLVSAGVVGLLRAVDHYDPKGEASFSTYAEKRIRGAILDSLREMDVLPRGSRRAVKAVESAVLFGRRRLGREPEEEEVAAIMGIPLAEYRQILASLNIGDAGAVEVLWEGGEGERVQLFVSTSDDGPAIRMERAEIETIIASAIDGMPANEKTVLTLYYYEELTLQEISKVLRVHHSRVWQLRMQAIIRLRTQFRGVLSR